MKQNIRKGVLTLWNENICKHRPLVTVFHLRKVMSVAARRRRGGGGGGCGGGSISFVQLSSVAAVVWLPCVSGVDMIACSAHFSVAQEANTSELLNSAAIDTTWSS